MYMKYIAENMPNQTVFNLPDKKRTKISELAIAEFANADYDNASISNIVKQAKIAKGSFYQYFEDKADLYLYLFCADLTILINIWEFYSLRNLLCSTPFILC